MRSFFNLVGFEYKKLFKRKNTVISLFLVFIVLIFLSITSVKGKHYWHSIGSKRSPFEAMKLDKEVIQSKSGYVDESLIKEAIKQNAIMISNDGNYVVNDYGRHLKSDAYIKYILPYEHIVNIINYIYETNTKNLSTDGFKKFNVNNVKPIDRLTENDVKNFYTLINQSSIEYINNLHNLSQNEKNKHMKMLMKVKTPYYNDYYDGYLYFSDFFKVIGLILLIAIAISISPIFANEYYLKTDQIVLSSKYGKNKVVFAKLFTVITFSLGVSFVTMMGFLLLMLLIHGFSGSNVPIQMISIYSTYPITLGKASLIAIIVTIFITLFFSLCIMLFSSLFKSSFSVVIVSFLLIIIPGIFEVSTNTRFLYQILQIFPVKAIDFPNIYSEYLFEILGLVLTPATFYISFSIIGDLLLLPVICNTFKNHQVQ